MIIWFPAQTAEGTALAVGALVVEVEVQELDAGLYLPPVLSRLFPPHTTISVPVQTAARPFLPEGAVVVSVAVQELPTGSYMPPVSK